ncbi:MAG: hypothetical protein GX886_09020, partial [Comamonadaceae bacterium]|nr:hypothetical protein [Comamonadaceae bacterium]
MLERAHHLLQRALHARQSVHQAFGGCRRHLGVEASVGEGREHAPRGSRLAAQLGARPTQDRHREQRAAGNAQRGECGHRMDRHAEVSGNPSRIGMAGHAREPDGADGDGGAGTRHHGGGNGHRKQQLAWVVHG